MWGSEVAGAERDGALADAAADVVPLAADAGGRGVLVVRREEVEDCAEGAVGAEAGDVAVGRSTRRTMRV